MCDQLKDLGLKVITLSGGEPTTCSDWHIIAKRLVDNGIITSIITNGWLIDENFVHNAITSGIRSVCLSIDGLEKTHDFIRRSGSFNKSIKALKELRKNNISTSVITSINKENICELEELYQLLSDLGVYSWQLQIALPMGNFAKRPEWLIEPQDILSIIDFAYNKIGGKLLIVLADSIGYYSNKDIKVNDKEFDRIEAIICSMTNKERRNPKLLNASRRKRIASGSGTSVQEINKFMPSFETTQKLMKKIKTGKLLFQKNKKKK